MRDREIERQTYRQTDIQSDRQTEWGRKRKKYQNKIEEKKAHNY